MTLRELIRHAQLSGWEHVIHSGSFGVEHTWTDRDHRVGIEFIDGIGARMTVSRRRRHLSVLWEDKVATVLVTSVGQVVGVLSALEVLTSPAERAA